MALLNLAEKKNRIENEKSFRMEMEVQREKINREGIIFLSYD